MLGLEGEKGGLSVPPAFSLNFPDWLSPGHHLQPEGWASQSW